MTYRNKGLRGFLALLMAALMVLGMCGFGYAADALEDVEVDETILIDEPTDTDEAEADEPADTDEAEADEPADTDEAEADEPDEDDVEVVTQKSEEMCTLTIDITLGGVDPGDIPETDTIRVKLTSDPETQYYIDAKYDRSINRWTGTQKVRADQSGYTESGNTKYKIEIGAPIINGYTYNGWEITGLNSDSDTIAPEGVVGTNKNIIMVNNEDEYGIKYDIRLAYKKGQSSTGKFTINCMLVENGKETTYDIGSFSDGDSITLPPLPKVDGCTVIGWFIGEEEESASEPTEGSGEVPPVDADKVEKSADVVEQNALSLPQYGTLVKPGTIIPATKNMTLYAYAVKAGTPVTYSAYLRINKVDEEGNPVAGAGFTMTNGQTSQGSAGRTDEQGQLLIGMLDVGEFTITETTVPEGYMAGAPVTVNVTAANTRDNPCVVTIVNTKVAGQPTASPTGEPTGEPTVSPTDAPSGEPTVSPTDAPTGEPTVSPTDAPSGEPTVSPTDKPTARPTAAPTDEADGEEVPKTGDNGLGYLYALMGLSGLGIAAMLLMLRKLRRS